MSRDQQLNFDSLFNIRIGNVGPNTKTEDVVRHFENFGKIADVSRPVNMKNKVPRPFIFVRYFSREAAEAALTLNLLEIDGNPITVNWAKQDSFFTQDTGYITNSEFDRAPVNTDDVFDSSMPREHYLKKRQEAAKQADVFYSVRVDDLPSPFSEEEIRTIFGQAGEIGSVYYPYDYNLRKHKTFAFVRYLRDSDANRAVEMFNRGYLGRGREISVVRCYDHSYFSQNETSYSV